MMIHDEFFNCDSSWVSWRFLLQGQNGSSLYVAKGGSLAGSQLILVRYYITLHKPNQYLVTATKKAASAAFFVAVTKSTYYALVPYF